MKNLNPKTVMNLAKGLAFVAALVASGAKAYVEKKDLESLVDNKVQEALNARIEKE